MQEFTNESWYTQLPRELQDNVSLSLYLYKREAELETKLADYSYIVFPIAKAYEGFLKSYFFSLNLISRQVYEGTRFRVGRALNPDISGSHKDEQWVYDDVAQLCGEQIARQLWQAWLDCRNRVFHYYPHKQTHISIATAYSHITQLIEAIKAASECKIADNEAIKNREWKN